MGTKHNKSLLDLELYKTIFNNSNDPQYILDLKTNLFLEVNRAFELLSGYKRRELIGKLKSTDLTPSTHYHIIQKKRRERAQGVQRDRYQFNMLTKTGELKPLEVSVHRLKINHQEVTLGSIRDISERLRLEKALRDKITEIALAGNRLMALTEKIKNVPILTTTLLKSKTEEKLCEQTIKLLCDPRGLRYKDAAIYFVKEGRLNLYRCSKIMMKKRGKLPPRVVNLSKNHRFAKIIRNELKHYKKSNEILLPLKGLKQNIGLIRILLDPKEKELMDANQATKKGYENVLETIVSILGLLTESIRLDQILEIQSIIDELTQVHNRRYFERMIKEETERARRYRRSLSLFLLDLNKFKEINDTAGHKQGDIILSEVARLLKRYSRKVDIVCRYGGDEFALILPETNAKGALKKATSLYDKIKKYRFSNIKKRNKPYHITISFGISTLSKDKKVVSEEKLISIADKALYQAKNLKKRQVKIL